MKKAHVKAKIFVGLSFLFFVFAPSEAASRILTAGLLCLLTWALILWTGRTKLTFGVVFCVLFLLQLANFIKIRMLDQMVLAVDYLAFKNVFMGTEILDQYGWPAYVLVIFVLAVFTALWAYFCLGFKNFIQHWRRRVVALGLMSVLVALCPWVATRVFDDKGALMPHWNTYVRKGAVLVAYASFSKVGIDVPRDHLPPDRIDELLFSDDAKSTFTVVKSQPDLWVWLNESTWDPSWIDQAPGEKLRSMYPFFEGGLNTLAAGHAAVPTFGGSTWVSELAVWTGLDHRDFGVNGINAPYVLTHRLQDSYIRRLKKMGYHTVALYPASGFFFNAENAYAHYGFDEFLEPQDLGLKDPGNWNARTDDEFVESMVRVYRDRKSKTKKPVLVAVLTISNHGPHPSGCPSSAEVSQLSFPTVPDQLRGPLNCYLTRLQATNAAHMRIFAEQKKFWEQQKQEIWFLGFGDHWPGFEGKMRKLPVKMHEPLPFDLTYYTWVSNNPQRAKWSLPKTEDLVYLLGEAVHRIPGGQAATQGTYLEGLRSLRDLCGGLYRGCSSSEVLSAYRSYAFDHLRVVR